MPRPKIVSVLIRREIRRLKKNPSALAMLGLLIAIAFAMSMGAVLPGAGGTAEPESMATVGIVYDVRTPLVEHLMSHVPAGQDVRFEHRRRLLDHHGNLFCPKGWTIVQLRNGDTDKGRLPIEVRYADASEAAVTPFLTSFRASMAQHFDQQPWVELSVAPRPDQAAGAAGVGAASIGDLMKSEVLGTALLLMVQFFCSCHLLVSFTAQDREHRTLHAIALTRARLSEIMLAKGIFHLTLTLAGCTAIAAILEPAVLTNPLFWAVIIMGSVSTMCVGTCIATLAKNQAAAGMLALCYMMAGAILFFLATKFKVFALLKGLTVECYSFHLLYFAFRNPGLVIFLKLLIPMAILTLMWLYVARRCFYRFGWK